MISRYPVSLRTFTKILVFAGTVAVGGCGSVADRIVGKWASADESFEFFDGGSCVFLATRARPCDYAVGADNRIRIDVEGTIFIGELKGSKMVITMADKPAVSGTFTKQ